MYIIDIKTDFKNYTVNSRKKALEEYFLPFKRLDESKHKNMFSSMSGKYLSQDSAGILADILAG